jgi:hypothetical protein
MITQEDGSYFRAAMGTCIAHVDAVIHVKSTANIRRLSGCYCLDECDGQNLQCDPFGIDVATKFTDSWIPHCVVFDPLQTVLMNGDRA